MHPVQTEIENFKVLYLMYQGLYESEKQLEEPRKCGKIRKTAENKPKWPASKRLIAIDCKQSDNELKMIKSQLESSVSVRWSWKGKAE